MLRNPHLALVFLLAAPLAAQQIDDPANLMGERVSPPALADTLPINHGAPALEQLLRKLRTRASLMLIVAHPDDEDSGLLTLESRGKGARVAMLTLTRGEGGQNLMTADFNDALGLIRTQELLAEDRYTGTDQFFGTEVDFGFSKTKEESFKMWTHDRVLYDAVRSVRLYRPLVLASVFIGGVTDGHGQHQVSGEITQEVFLAAADPKIFPEMGLPPWAPLRVYARVPFAPITDKGMFDYATGKFLPPHFHNYVTGKDTTTPPVATVTIHEGEVPNIPAFEGKSYVQWARQGLALQKTQIGTNFRIPPPGRVDVGYTLYGSRTHCTATNSRITANPGEVGSATETTKRNNAGAPCLDSETWASAKPTALPSHAPTSSDDEGLFSGIDTSLPSIADLAPQASHSLRTALAAIDRQFAEAQALYNPTHLERTEPALSAALRGLEALIVDTQQSLLDPTEKFNVLHELRVKAVQVDEALLLALSVKVDAQTDLTRHADGSPRPATTRISDANLGDSFNVRLTWHSSSKDISPNKDGETNHVTPRGRIMESCPYFDRTDLKVPSYEVSPASLRNAPNKPTFYNDIALRFEDLTLIAGADIVNGDQPLRIVAPVNVEMRSQVGIFKPSTTSFPVQVEVTTDSPNEVKGTLRLQIPDAWTTTPDSFPFVLSPEDRKGPQDFTFIVNPARIVENESYKLKAQARVGFTDFTRGYRQVGYPGLAYSDFCTRATYTAVPVDVTTAPNLRIAYLPGTGDDVPQYLPSLGVTPTLLTAKDLTADNLQHYDAILLGVRAYAAHPELAGTGSDPLKAFAEAGGIVIAQYSSGGFDPASAPFPYTIPGDSAHNVVDEDQPVQLLAPANPLLTWPNRITSADFDHWIEERGHGFASDWAPQFTPLLETHDPDQDPQRGGLLVARVGKGAYIYCAFALYRQLPEGVPGAYRLLANLLSYARNPAR